MSSNNESFQETCNLFNSESKILQDAIENTLGKDEQLSIREIVNVYYQIMNVNSLLEFLKQQIASIEKSHLTEEQKLLLSQINNTENLISTKFDANLHPVVISQLTNSIKNSMTSLKSAKKDIEKKSKEDIEQQAQLYDRLRELMSTKEFVDQYDKGLKHD